MDSLLFKSLYVYIIEEVSFSVPACVQPPSHSFLLCVDRSRCICVYSAVAARLSTRMHLDELDYALPTSHIAQRPLSRREASRLLLLDRVSGVFQDKSFAEFPNLLHGDELLVLNNARVIPARLFGRRAGVHSQPASRSTRSEHLAGKVEVLLTRQVGAETWEALVRPGRKMHVGERVLFGKGELEGEIVARGALGQRTLRFTSNDSQFQNPL